MATESYRLFAAVDRMIEEHEAKKYRLTALESEIATKKKQRDELLPQIALLEEVRIFLQELAEVTRDEIMLGLQQVVTLCLQSVFGPDVRFEIEVDTKRNSTSVEFYVVNTEGEYEVRLKPEDSMGGGVIDAIAIGLRYGLLKILNPPPKGPIAFDEPAKMVSADRIHSIGHLFKELSPMFGKQTILVTHHTSLLEIIDHSIFVRKENGVSICETGSNHLELIQKTFGTEKTKERIMSEGLEELRDAFIEAAAGGETNVTT